jgi:hypothetical protein
MRLLVLLLGASLVVPMVCKAEQTAKAEANHKTHAGSVDVEMCTPHNCGKAVSRHRVSDPVKPVKDQLDLIDGKGVETPEQLDKARAKREDDKA